MLEGSLHGLRHGVNSADVFLVPHQRRVLERLALMVALSVAFLERLSRLLREAGQEILHALEVEGDAGGRAHEDQLLQAPRAAPGVGAAQHAAPALAQEVEAPVTELKVVDEVVQLLDKQVKGPECVVSHLFAQVRRSAAADLVIEDDGNPVFFLKVNEGCQVLVTAAWAAVEGDQRLDLGSEVTDNFVPCCTGLPSAGRIESNLTFRREFGGHLRTILGVSQCKGKNECVNIVVTGM